MEIFDWKKESFIDYPGKISTIIFTAGCNYNCGYCHNPELKNLGGHIPEEKIFNYLDSRKGWINAVVISGGEPTIQFSIQEFIRKIKIRGLAVKLDTNGNYSSILDKFLEENVIDYVAMDVKGPISLYPKIIGRDFIDERDNIGKGLVAVSKFPDYEFRTTIIPIYDNEKIRWMTPREIGQTAKLISNWTEGAENIKYFLQPFRAIEKKEGDNKFMKKNLPKEFWITPKDLLEEGKKEAQKFLPNTKIR
ncbi:anaerobic ribonucleoside-triphosphate reductase activating protein [Candidatus Pacearchaeota archaeon]|nr:anaerobic ribonucleoside-triphosphate reductase activating protein [Candidatus Pacearchaeota archaeon]